MKKVTFRSVVLLGCIYASVGTSGYTLFRQETAGNILENFPPSDKLMTICKTCIAISLTANLPLYLHPARESLYALFPWLTRVPSSLELLTHIVVTCCLMTLVLWLAVSIPEVSVVFSFLGATCCVIMSYVFPIALYVHLLSPSVPSQQDGENKTTGDKLKMSTLTRIKATKAALILLLCLVIGVGVMSVVGTAETLMKIKKASRPRV